MFTIICILQCHFACRIMENQVMVMCFYSVEIAVTSLPDIKRIHDLIAFVVGKRPNVKSNCVTLSYRVLGYSKWYMLENDGDLDNITIIVNQMNIDCVDIQVDDIETDNDSMDMEDNVISTGNLSLQVLVRL